MGKVFVFGIDGAAPELIFDKWKSELPVISSLLEKGQWGRIESTIPPSTILAWSSIFSGKDPGELGVYSYTRRESNRLTNSLDIKQPMIWNLLKDKKSIVLNVPLTYPLKPMNGIMISGFLTPAFNDKSIFPAELKTKVREFLGEDYMFDVSGFVGYKSIPTAQLLERTYKMTNQQLDTAKWLLKEDWDLFVCVLIGPDRLQHMLWRYFDKNHKYYEETEFKDALKDFYKYIDKRLGEFLKELNDDVTVIVSSDHGMAGTKGRINLNDWLIKEGYLVLTETPTEQTRLKPDMIDFTKTKVHSVGAYQGRLYINRQIVSDVQDFLKELAEKLKQIPDSNGNQIDTRTYLAEQIYKQTDSESPDMIVYFDNLRWGINPNVGNKGTYSWVTKLGADSAGHAPEGIYVITGKKISHKNKNIKTTDMMQIMMEAINDN